MKRLLKLLPHLLIIVSLMFMTFYIIDLINPAMVFIDNAITKTMLFVFSILVIIQSFIVYLNGRKGK